MRTLIGAFAMLMASAGIVSAASVDTIFIMDESGSMAGEQTWIRDTVITALDSELAAAGLTDRKYGVVGYGATIDVFGHTHTSGAGGPNDLMSATDAQVAMNQWEATGGTEDGYEAINFALSNLNFTAGAALNVILITDEDRDVETTDTYASILALLNQNNAILNVVVSNDFFDPGQAPCIGVSSGGTGYVADGSGGYNTTTCTVGNGAGNTENDYVPMALATGGAAWDLDILRGGGNPALSFTDAFVDIKVKEVVDRTNPNPIPVPGSGLLLMAALGAGAAFSRRAKAA